MWLSGRVAQSVGHLTRKSGVLGSIPGLATYFRFSFRFFKKGSCQLLAKVCARSTGYRLGGLSLPRKSVVRLTDRPDMTLVVYRGRKTTMQQQQQSCDLHHKRCCIDITNSNYMATHYMSLTSVVNISTQSVIAWGFCKLSREKCKEN